MRIRNMVYQLYWKLFPPRTVLDQIRTKNDTALIAFLRQIHTGEEIWADFTDRFCRNCEGIDTINTEGETVRLHPCDDVGRGCPYGDTFAWWLQQGGANEKL